jgi:hypothetical protein
VSRFDYVHCKVVGVSLNWLHKNVKGHTLLQAQLLQHQRWLVGIRGMIVMLMKVEVSAAAMVWTGWVGIHVLGCMLASTCDVVYMKLLKENLQEGNATSAVSPSLSLSLLCMSSPLSLLAAELCCDLVIGQHAGTNMVVNMACVYRKCSSTSSSSSQGQHSTAATR